jgi:hypothetical protein
MAMRGSWNRMPTSGYQVVRVKFSRDGALERIEPFIFSISAASPSPQQAVSPIVGSWLGRR